MQKGPRIYCAKVGEEKKNSFQNLRNKNSSFENSKSN